MAGIMKRVPKYCHIARSFGDNGKEAKRQLPIWRKKIGRTIGVDQTVHLYHSKSKGWAIVLCSPDYNRTMK